MGIGLSYIALALFLYHPIATIIGCVLMVVTITILVKHLEYLVSKRVKA